MDKSSSNNIKDNIEDFDHKDTECVSCGAHAREVCMQDSFNKLFVQGEDCVEWLEAMGEQYLVKCISSSSSGDKEF